MLETPDMHGLRRASFLVCALPLLALTACNHHTGLSAPRAEAGPDAGWPSDLGGNIDEASVALAPDGPSQDLNREDGDAGLESGWAPDLGRDQGETSDGPPDAPFQDLAMDAALPPNDASILDGPPPAMLVIEPTSAELPVVFVGDKARQSWPVVFRVQNSGGTATGVLQSSLADPNASYFDIVSDTCSGMSLSPQEGCDVGVVWAPLQVGNRWTGTLVVTDPNSGQFVSAALTGRTLLGDCLMVSGSPLDLGSVLPGATGEEVRAVVTNFCNFDLGTVWETWGGRDANVVRVSTNTCAPTLGPKGSCVIGLQLVPPIDAKPTVIEASVQVGTSEGGMYVIWVKGEILGPSSPGPDASVDGAQGDADTAPDGGAVLF